MAHEDTSSKAFELLKDGAMTKIADTLYAKYIAERESAKILENEHGFIIYKLVGEECFIMEMQVEQSIRKQGHGRSLVQQLEETEKECRFITANIWLKKPGAMVVLMGALKCGFKVTRGSDEVLLIVKDLMEG